MQLDPAAFNAHFRHMGQNVAWRRSHACPCINPASRHAKPNCPRCNGKGRTWDDEKTDRIGVTSQSSKKMQAMFGVWEPGDVVLSIPSDSPIYEIGPYDRVRLLNATSRFSTALIRGEGDRLLGTIKCVDRVFWLASDGETEVEGGIPDVAANGALTWHSGAPAEGSTFSISGVKYDEYFCWPEQSIDRNIHGARLPRRLMARKFDLFGRND